MSMRESLELVRGAVSDKDLIPVLTHFHIYDGKIQGGNGRVSIEAPIDFKHKTALTVPADKFLRAIDAGAYKATPHDGNMLLQGGSLRVVLPLANSEQYPLSKPPKKWALSWAGDELLPMLRRLRPFIGSDASRAVFCSIAVRSGYAYAANNPTIARVPFDGVDMVLPIYLIDELLRVGIEPTGFHATDLLLSFRLSKGAWIQSVLLVGEWPDIESFFANRPKRFSKVPEGLIEAVKTVLPFCNDEKFPALHFSREGVSTSVAEMYAVAGELDLPEGRWHAKNILTVLTEATHINLKQWPEPCSWKGEGIEGITVGLV